MSPIIIATILALAAAQAPGGSIEGRWINPAKSVIIAIAPCGESQCGTVEWASPAAKADARKGAATLVGTALLTDLQPKGADRWQGKLYIPDRDMHVTAKIEREGEERIKVTGCAVGGLICDSQTWALSEGPPPAE
ncbi:MAG: DUF2147 domain-containing protein [Sphingomicrobium sp.]